MVSMGASSLRDEPRPDRNVDLRASIVALAQRHRRYGVGMIQLKLRQSGHLANYKRIERLYRLDKLHIGRRRRKKIPAGVRHALFQPTQANQVRSMDFVFDRVATGGTRKCLTIADDATHGSVGIAVEHSISGDHLTRILDAYCSLRGRPSVIRRTTARSSPARQCSPGRIAMASSCDSSSLASRTRTRTSSRSMGGCGTNA
jgi:transposase InsO family protein